MKRLLTRIVALMILVAGFWGCDDLGRTTYSGSDYVMFSDTLSMYPVQNSEQWFEIPVVATNICDYDRSFGVEVDDKASNAIEKKQYIVESNTVTIKAGERVANFRMKGVYENIGKTDSLSVTFNLLVKDENKYHKFEKIHPIDIEKRIKEKLDFNVIRSLKSEPSPVIVGSGPAGLFRGCHDSPVHRRCPPVPGHHRLPL